MNNAIAQQTGSYVIVTAAYNEEKHIGRVIEAVLSQTLLPKRWIIVSDASTDGTDEIVAEYAKTNEIIEHVRITEEHPRNFAAQVHAINRGISECKEDDYDYIGNLDADVSFGPRYFEELLGKFAEDLKLGLAGGDIWEEIKGTFRPRWTNQPRAVAHAVQLFRRQCFEAMGGGYVALPYGGPDSLAEIQCRMKGWKVQSFAELVVLHHRPGGGADRWARSAFREGRMDHSLGIGAGFEILRLLRRVLLRPYFAYSFVRLLGFVHANLSGAKRAVPDDCMQYLRSEERDRVRSITRRALGLS